MVGFEICYENKPLANPEKPQSVFREACFSEAA